MRCSDGKEFRDLAESEGHAFEHAHGDELFHGVG